MVDGTPITNTPNNSNSDELDDSTQRPSNIKKTPAARALYEGLGQSRIDLTSSENSSARNSSKLLAMENGDAPRRNSGENSSARRVSFAKKDITKATRILGMGDDVIGLPSMSETESVASSGNTGTVRRARFADSLEGSFDGSQDEGMFAGNGIESKTKKPKGRRGKAKNAARSLVASIRRKGGYHDTPKRDSAHSTSSVNRRQTEASFQPLVKSNQEWNNNYTKSTSLDNDTYNYEEPIKTRKSVVDRRDNLDVKSLTMGLDLESANFLDWVARAKCQEWLKSLSGRDPRACIKMFFDDVARDGADNIEHEKGFQPELLSPLLSMFQRSSVFSVWRPTSVDSIRKMMKGEGTGKGLEIKGKSAKKGKLSAYVPFLQIHEDKHKHKIRLLPPKERIRIFYKKREARDNAQKILVEVLKDMTEATTAALSSLLDSGRVTGHEFGQDGYPPEVGRVLSAFQSLDVQGLLADDEKENVKIVNGWSMDNPSIIVIDDYSPKCFGLDMPKRLFWEGYVMRAKDISREPGSVYDTGRPSRASFQDMNFASIKNECEEDTPRAVVWQYTDPYLPPTEPDPDPMMPQTLLMAYEEHGRVMPVVSDFDCFLLGTRGVRFHSPLPDFQVELVHNMIGDIEKILKACTEGKSKNWTASWLEVIKHQKKHVTMPRYGYGDPKSYAIMKHAVQRLEEFGAVRHGAECFNFYFPQELDDEFLVIGGNLGGEKYKYMKLNELQDFLSGCVDLGFTFPLNPKWVLCDEGWKALWDKLTGSKHPNVELSINAWYPPGSGIKERIEEIHQQFPQGFQSDLSGRKKGTQAWDEAEVALDRYQRIQRAKRKLWAVMKWISIVEVSKQRAQANGSDDEDAVQKKRVSFQNQRSVSEKRLSTGSKDDSNGRLSFSSITGSDVSFGTLTEDAISRMGGANQIRHVRAQTENGMPGFPRKLQHSSSIQSEDEDHSQNIEVIDSLLFGNLHLSEYQTAGLQKIRDHFAGKTQPRINNRMERRHTSIDGRMAALMLEDVPSFILKEYGGAKNDGTISFKAQVKKIMNAQRLMKTTKRLNEPQNANENLFLPVEWTSMGKKKKETLAKMLSFEALSSWEYNMVQLAKLCDGSPLLFVGWAIIGSPHAQQAMANDLGQDHFTKTSGYDFSTELNVQMPILCSFLRTVELDYLPNPYHNNTHAADVVQTLNTMLQLGGKDYASAPVEIFSILVAAVIHDVKHPGLNNNFQVNSRSDLAVQYNDVSVLENYSITWLFSKLLGQTRDFTVDVFSGLSNDQFSKCRSIIIRAVLETDMTHHFALLKKMGIHQEMLKGKDAEAWLHTYTNEGVNYDPSMDMLCFLLHQADISNPAKPYPLFVHWADSILSESYSQGDKELSLSLPISPLCDRKVTDKKQSQIGFIKFVVQPSYQLLGEIIPLFARTVKPYIEKSLEFWDKYEGESNC
mmetsp:Transcript_38573/g.81128  ORF Transcript_38573/g.81128 Transcript_38573/m.81128 type:complete len:1434 (-) Transcript_38573:177-4478(-)|eukprot:CAMPEP_0183734814 /NCGR_PEP_ID=MMETSP0737-20130205/44943_1 /TAXON_ID=385413 /ORGANISM="Thalassiosira miniscula, Strain CCMP1093" /LENGTH=1433 /DNA_ID=CAMNT_0025968421 /DNA_START=87 /DNA_END=4388 /DNA_ORIENTATION=+